MMADELSLHARLFAANLRKARTEYFGVAATRPGTQGQAINDAAAVLVEELAQVFARLNDPAERFSLQLYYISQLPGAVEGVRAAVLAMKRGEGATRQ